MSASADTWWVDEPCVDVDAPGAGESWFTVSNGYLGIRGTLDEVEPHGRRGTYLAGFYETHPLAYPEGGYGHPEEGQAMISVADGTPLRIVVDGTPLDARELAPEVHARRLDLRTGIVTRTLRWTTTGGTTVELVSERLASLTEKGVAAIRLRLRATGGRAHVVVRSELVLGATPPEVENDDPRVAEALDHPFDDLTLTHDDTGGVVGASTRRTRLGVATAVQHLVDGADRVRTEAVSDDHVVTTTTADLGDGDEVTIVKVLGYAWSHEPCSASLCESARAVADAGVDRGWDGLADAQRAALDGFWAVADVEVDGDDELQRALRYSLFVLHTSTALIADAPLGAKALTGLGYSGHTFWDVEGFVIPALSLLVPDTAERLLRWRAGTLPAARERAEVLDLAGATFAWRTIDGHETSAYWPASTAAMHINADVSRAFWLHGNVTGGDPVALGTVDVLAETARLWLSLGVVGADGAWHLFGMTGPDEYTGVVDDNVFTNLMARRNLLRAADLCDAHPDAARLCGVDTAETARWREVADAMHVPWDAARGVHPANTGFTDYREWPFAERLDDYPVQDHAHYATIYRHQVVKQADLVLALWWCREDFTDEQIARDLDYYEARTVRDSSLSAATQAVVSATAQHIDLAYRYLRESALVDLHDLRGDTADGLHLASVGGTWHALTAGLGGLREDGDDLELAPLLPQRLTRVAYRLTWRGRLLQVVTTRDATTVTLCGEGESVDVIIDGVRHTVAAGSPASAPLRTPDPLLPEPRQPAGRAPDA